MLGIRRGWGRERGQTLIIIAIAMPLFLAVIALVTDGSMLLVHKRSLQVAADAASLAAAQEITTGTCDLACQPLLQDRVEHTAGEYSDKNGGPSYPDINGKPTLPLCTSPSKTNCAAVKPSLATPAQVEVRLTTTNSTLFTRAIGLKNLFDVSARAVAGTGFSTGTTVTGGTTIDPSTVIQTVTGGTHTTTDPDTEVIGGVGFALSRRCDGSLNSAIVYQGAGSGTAVLGAFATNGGLLMSGNKPKKVTTLYYNQSGCPTPSADSGTNRCTAKAWGDATDSDNLCVKTLVDLNANNALPLNWPLPLPTVPTPKSGTWNASTDYPSSCINLGNTGTITFAAASPPGPPGIYCVSGASTILKVTGNGVNLTGGEGYTFFALGGAKINVASNTLKLKFYWPNACGTRPTGRPASFTCFGRTITGYDPQTLLYATNPTNDASNCLNDAICLNGNSNELTGDVFAPKPDAFPPTPGPTDTGGTVAIEGGALSAGSGFFESWNLSIKGNTGSYAGTGPFIIPGGIHVTTDPSTTTTTVYPGTTVPGTTQTITTGTTYGLDE